MYYAIVIGLCILTSAYFSATETAFNLVNKIKLRSMAGKGNKKAKRVLRLLDDYDNLLSSILIGNNLVNILASSTATIVFVNKYGEDVGTAVSTLVTTMLLLIFGEISPKSIAKEDPERFSMFSAPFLGILIKVLMPLNLIFSQWKKLLSMVFTSHRDDSTTEEEVITTIDDAARDGEIDKDEKVLLHNVIDFAEMEVEDIMTPRLNIIGVDIHSSVEEIKNTFLETGFSRLPVYDGSLDSIKGILYLKDFNKEKDINKITKPAMFIPEHKLIGKLLKELQSKKMHFAIVIDEFGAVTGIVTMEDILEELVGEIWDEHDKIVKEIEQKSDNVYEILGTTNIVDALDALGLAEDEDIEATTVSGWAMECLDKIPKEGDKFKYNNLSVIVLKMDGNMVDKIRVKIMDEA